MIETNQNEFIETIRAKSAGELIENFRRDLDEKTRVIVLIIENSFEIDESVFESLENSEIPVILALKAFAGEKFVDSCHLCIASQTAQIGEFSAEDALKSGLVNKVVAFEEVETEAFSLAEKISKLAPLAIRACLKAVTKGLNLPLEESLKIETELFAQIFSTADMREGTRAFLEKREPVFTGK